MSCPGPPIVGTRTWYVCVLMVRAYAKTCASAGWHRASAIIPGMGYKLISGSIPGCQSWLGCSLGDTPDQKKSVNFFSPVNILKSSYG